MFTSFKRICKSSWLSFRRNSAMSLATTFILAITISLITALFLFNQLSQFLISSLKEKVDISVYFENNVSPEEILKIKEKISQIPEVKKVEYISDEEAKKKLLEKNPELVESIRETEKYLNLASLNITAWKAEQYQAIVNLLEKSEFKDLIADIDYSQRKTVIERLFSIISFVSWSGIFLTLILGSIGILVAFNQVRLAIYNLKDEITIQRLVGASNWFIRGPFLVQGVLAGFFATIISLLFLLLLLYFLSPKFEIIFSDFNLYSYFIKNFFTLFLIQLSTGIFLGIISSLIAIRKYLEV